MQNQDLEIELLAKRLSHNAASMCALITLSKLVDPCGNFVVLLFLLDFVRKIRLEESKQLFINMIC